MNFESEKEISASPSIKELFEVFGHIGLISFGGPAGQIALMHREIVDEKKWLSEEDFLHALNFCHFLPGPEAQQLAAYIGWKLKGVMGGVITGLLFILPGALVILGLSIIYAYAADIFWFQALFTGIKAGVLAIVAQALLRISTRALKTNFDYFIAILAFIGLFFFNLPFPLIIIIAGILGAIATLFGPKSEKIIKPTNINYRSKIIQSIKAISVWGGLWAIPFILIFTILGTHNVFWDIAVFFSKLAVVTFGGAYAVLAYMAQEAVQTYAWLSPSDMTNGLGFAETTPGPLILVTQYVGFLAAFNSQTPFSPIIGGIIAAFLTSWVTFVPCFLWIFTFAPWIDGLKSSQILKGSLSAITAAIVGVIANLSIWFALHVVFAKVENIKYGMFSLNIPELSTIIWGQSALIIVAFFLLFKIKISPLKLILTSSILGLILNLFSNFLLAK